MRGDKAEGSGQWLSTTTEHRVSNVSLFTSLEIELRCEIVGMGELVCLWVYDWRHRLPGEAHGKVSS